MTVMSRAEAKAEKRRQAIDHVLPDADAIIHGIIENVVSAHGIERHGFDSRHEIARYVENKAIHKIEQETPIHPDDDDYAFVEDEIDYAECEAYDIAMAEMEVMAEEGELPDLGNREPADE